MTTSQMSSQDPIRSACVEMSPTEGQLTKEQISWVAESTTHSARASPLENTSREIHQKKQILNKSLVHQIGPRVSVKRVPGPLAVSDVRVKPFFSDVVSGWWRLLSCFFRVECITSGNPAAPRTWTGSGQRADAIQRIHQGHTSSTSGAGGGDFFRTQRSRSWRACQ